MQFSVIYYNDVELDHFADSLIDFVDFVMDSEALAPMIVKMEMEELGTTLRNYPGPYSTVDSPVLERSSNVFRSELTKDMVSAPPPVPFAPVLVFFYDYWHESNLEKYDS